MNGSSEIPTWTERLIEIADLRLQGNSTTLHGILNDTEDPVVITACLEALFSLGVDLSTAELKSILTRCPDVRVITCIASSFSVAHHDLHDVLLAHAEPAVVEAACFAIGESEDHYYRDRLQVIAKSHNDALCRESAIAALGALGDPSSLEVVLAALDDKPYIRRRAIVALAAFDDPRVEEALQRALNDRDVQVRTLAEDLLKEPGGSL